ncbi:cytochrome b/b6 domain-containing protein [Candidatus Cyanaurora vandensis]|uniref:cytochrome b/b6 domain-containing protein n=1 Tax=Candidatus Cyanaurora vandensis TaxID=2714958 RepID=UPI00257D01DA|nr:cytochrome b/b6 domain-containing protein [Candidatus Cyanaurora vandensis]
MTTATPKSNARKPPVPKQDLAIKVFHWVNIISLFALMGSGLRIYNANPVFGGRGGWTFPTELTLGVGLAGARHWHFFFMWFFGLNLLWYGIYILFTKRWKNRYVSSSDVKVLREGNNPKRKNYAYHRLVYTLFIPLLLLAVLTGLGMWKPVQFGWIVALFGSWQALRVVHFFSIPAVLFLLIFHSLLALKVGEWRLVRSIFA